MLKTVETVLFSDFFLSQLLSYLGIRDIVTMDTAICSKSIRDIWLKHIANGIGSVCYKIQPFLLNDGSIKWCSSRSLQFKYLDLDYGYKQFTATTDGAILLAKCCINIVEFSLYPNRFGSQEVSNELIIQIGQRCKKINTVYINSAFSLTDHDIAPIFIRNPNLVEIKLRECESITDTTCRTIADNCHSLKQIEIGHLKQVTNEGFMELLRSRRDLEDIKLSSCPLLTDVTLIAIANYCHQLRRIRFYDMYDVTPQGIASLVSVNHDLEEIVIFQGINFTGDSLITN